MTDWIIRYTDGSEVNSDDVDHPRDAPSSGVAWVWSEKGIAGQQKRLAEQKPFFVYDCVEEQWYDHDWVGLIDRLLLRQDAVCVKLGRYMPDDLWRRSRESATALDREK